LGKLVNNGFGKLSPGKWIQGMDTAVALSLWKYAKEDIAKQNGISVKELESNEELMRECAKYYEQVVFNTQSMADVLHRPEVQKGSGIMSEILGLFKTDLYQMYGQLNTSINRYRKNKTKQNKVNIVKSASGILASALWAQLMTTVFALLRYKVNPYRDEEDEVTFESWLSRQGINFGVDLLGYLLPLGIPELGNFIISAINGESTEVASSIVLDLINEAGAQIGAFIRDPSPKSLKGFITTLLQGFGVPAKNVSRIIEAIMLHGEDIANGEFLSFEAGVNRSEGAQLYRAYLKGDKEKIAEAEKKFDSRGKIESSLKQSLRTKDERIREATVAELLGSPTARNSILNEIVSEGKFKRSLIYEAESAEAEYIRGKLKEYNKLLKNGEDKEAEEIFDKLEKRGYNKKDLEALAKKIK
jgi:hypothetical protein